MRWTRFTLVTVMATIAAVNGISPISAVAILVGGAIACGAPVSPVRRAPTSSSSAPNNSSSQDSFDMPEETGPPRTSSSSPTVFRYYREKELRRVVASLKANSSFLVAGSEGSGKSVLKGAVVEQLSDEGFTVVLCEPTTPKQMLIEIAEQLGVDKYNLEGKALSADELKRDIATHLERNTAFLVIDDAHLCTLQFRTWLKSLKRQGVPMLLLATDPPRKDIFINLPPLELQPLPEYAIRELMEQAALERGLNLKSHELARLQERVGGNPMLASRVIDEEYLGLDIETGDHRRYLDITPLVLLVGVCFIVIRFIGLGTNNQALYIFGGVLAAIFLGVSRILYNLPGDSRRIQS